MQSPSRLTKGFPQLHWSQLQCLLCVAIQFGHHCRGDIAGPHHLKVRKPRWEDSATLVRLHQTFLCSLMFLTSSLIFRGTSQRIR